MTSTYSAYMGLALGPNSSGAFDISFHDPGADNCFSLTVDDASTMTSGYLQGYYLSMTTTGAYSTGNTQINGFALDMFIGGTLSTLAGGGYFYIAPSGSPTLTGAQIYGLYIDLQDMGSAPAYLNALRLDRTITNKGSTSDSWILCNEHTANGTTYFTHFKGGTLPEYFFLTDVDSSGMIAAFTTDTSATRALRIKIGSSVYNIALYPDSCS